MKKKKLRRYIKWLEKYGRTDRRSAVLQLLFYFPQISLFEAEKIYRLSGKGAKRKW